MYQYVITNIKQEALNLYPNVIPNAPETKFKKKKSFKIKLH